MLKSAEFDFDVCHFNNPPLKVHLKKWGKRREEKIEKVKERLDRRRERKRWEERERASERPCLCCMSLCVCAVEDSSSPRQCNVPDESAGLSKYTRLLFTSDSQTSELQNDTVPKS